MIRLFKVYYPLRTLVLLAGEALIVWISFVCWDRRSCCRTASTDFWLVSAINRRRRIPEDSGGHRC